MNAITLDPDLRAKLNGLNQTLEVREEDGRVVGRFLPEEEYRRMQYDLALAACPYSEEELNRLRQAKGGTPLAEFWKKLGVPS